MSDADLSAIAADLAALRGERQQTITIRRDGAPAPGPQAVRVELSGTAPRTASGEAIRAQQAGAVVSGAADLDIRVGDRFSAGGAAYRVTFVSPNRSVGTIADAIVQE